MTEKVWILKNISVIFDYIPGAAGGGVEPPVGSSVPPVGAVGSEPGIDGASGAVGVGSFPGIAGGVVGSLAGGVGIPPGI